MIELRSLGSLGVTVDGHEVPIGGPRQRRLLAMLLVHRGEVVSVDRLAEAVFAGAPTDAAATTLRSYVARMRPVLDGGEVEVVTRAPGYALNAAMIVSESDLADPGNGKIEHAYVIPLGMCDQKGLLCEVLCSRAGLCRYGPGNASELEAIELLEVRLLGARHRAIVAYCPRIERRCRSVGRSCAPRPEVQLEPLRS